MDPVGTIRRDRLAQALAHLEQANESMTRAIAEVGAHASAAIVGDILDAREKSWKAARNIQRRLVATARRK